MDSFTAESFTEVMARSGDKHFDQKYLYPASLIISKAGKDPARFQALWFELQKLREQKGADVLNDYFGYDMQKGQPIINVPRALSAEEIAAQKSAAAQKKATLAAKVLRYHLDLAAQGDAYGEFKMRERYRDGDGVSKDLAKAREYFSKAAAQDYLDAKKALGKLSGQ